MDPHRSLHSNFSYLRKAPFCCISGSYPRFCWPTWLDRFQKFSRAHYPYRLPILFLFLPWSEVAVKMILFREEEHTSPVGCLLWLPRRVSFQRFYLCCLSESWRCSSFVQAVGLQFLQGCWLPFSLRKWLLRLQLLTQETLNEQRKACAFLAYCHCYRRWELSFGRERIPNSGLDLSMQSAVDVFAGFCLLN